MLQLSKSLIEVPILSLRIGGQVATAHKPIIDPNNLKIEGWHVTSNRQKGDFILLSQDVREVLPQGIVIDDLDVLAEPHDLVRHQELLKIYFPLLGHNVISDKKRRLGKVSDFATETTTFFIQKLYTQAPMIRGLRGGATTVERDQILEITDRKIVVKDPLQQTPVPQQAPQPPSNGPAPSPAHPIQ